jgi:phosphoribosylamine--glycine ligase
MYFMGMRKGLLVSHAPAKVAALSGNRLLCEPKLHPMNILILGSGGREHALAWKLRQSPLCETLVVAPGNPGTARIAINEAVNPGDFPAVAALVDRHHIHLLVVGPEAPLVAGIRDWFEATGRYGHLRIVGPGRQGAMLEGSKDFAKAFMMRHGIPTAPYRTFTAGQADAAEAYLSTLEAPYVLKADGLAAGKGVVILPELEEACREVHDMLGGKFGQASAKLVIERFLSGVEVSVFALTDGKDYVLLPEAKDYKRVGEGDTGPNTGGMGAVSPVPFADAAFMHKVEERIVRPTILGLSKEGIDYRGFIFFGLINCSGEPYVIEYNARMGDPETEAVLPRISSDLAPVLMLAAEGRLGQAIAAHPEGLLQRDPRTALTVMLVSGGYPGDYAKGVRMEGNLFGESPGDVLHFHAGTTAQRGEVLTAGGRVLAITAMGDGIQQAATRAYQAAGDVHFAGKQLRKDIGKDLV